MPRLKLFKRYLLVFLHGRLGRSFSGMDVDRERRPPAFFQVLEEALDVFQGLQRGEDAHGQRQYSRYAHDPYHDR